MGRMTGGDDNHNEKDDRHNEERNYDRNNERYDDSTIGRSGNGNDYRNGEGGCMGGMSTGMMAGTMTETMNENTTEMTRATFVGETTYGDL